MDLLTVVKRERPNLLILLGPFIDEKHRKIQVFYAVHVYVYVYVSVPRVPCLQQGEVDRTYDELLEDVLDNVASSLRAELPLLRIIIMPSLRDACGDSILPQPPFTVPSLASDPVCASVRLYLRIIRLIRNLQNVSLFSNPCMFEVQELVVGAVSEDVLFHMSRAEAGRTTDSDRFSRLANHLIEQRRSLFAFASFVCTLTEYWTAFIQSSHLRQAPTSTMRMPMRWHCCTSQTS